MNHFILPHEDSRVPVRHLPRKEMMAGCPMGWRQACGNSVIFWEIFGVTLRRDNHLHIVTHCSGMVRGTQQGVQGIDLVSKFPRSQLSSICGMCSKKTSPVQGGPTSQITEECAAKV